MRKHNFDQSMRWRLLAARNTLGRMLLRQRVRLRRLCWRWSLSFNSELKRAFDCTASAVLIILLLPVFALIALCIKLEDRGPVLFVQTRIGKYGVPFRMFKFRSMSLDAEQRLDQVLRLNEHGEGITFKIKKDPRVTRVGRWIRKISFDELPQLFNVFRGEMSLVGPRPPVPREVARYSIDDRRRLDIAPGITCFWQIGGRAELNFPQQVQLDLLYIERQCFWTDLLILFKTVPAVFNGRGAY